jgi:hypothetical protein
LWDDTWLQVLASLPCLQAVEHASRRPRSRPGESINTKVITKNRIRIQLLPHAAPHFVAISDTFVRWIVWAELEPGQAARVRTHLRAAWKYFPLKQLSARVGAQKYLKSPQIAVRSAGERSMVSSYLPCKSSL